MKILGTGLSGLVGSRVVELLSPEYSFENLSLETNVDITNRQTVYERVGSSDASWVFHFAARTDVEEAEKEKGDKDGNYWLTNALATSYFVDACKMYRKKLLYLSTDYVFDGTSKQYSESDTPHPLGWYAVTKFEGEKLVSTLGDSGLIARIANPYCEKPQFKLDFVHKIASILVKGESIFAPSDQIFVPTFIDDIAHTLKLFVEKNLSGVYHVVGSRALSPFEASCRIAKVIGAPEELVKPTSFEVYFEGRAKRPQFAHLSNAKAVALGAKLSTFEQGLAIIRRYLADYPN